MRVPISWVREFVPINVSVDELAQRLTVAGIEVEYIDRIGVFSPQAVVGEILSNEPVTDDGNLRELRVNAGREVTILSNSANLREAAGGVKIAVTLPGAMAFDRGEPGYKLRTIAAATIRGKHSEGAGASAAELGIGDDHSGVLVLDTDAPGGEPLANLWQPQPDWDADIVLHLAILPNIARCQSIIGVAREIAAITQTEATYEPAMFDVAVKSGEFDPEVEAPDQCPQFSTTMIEGVRVVPSPAWMRRRLVLCGLEPINLVVDATNYVALELGQPTHAYDADRLPSTTLGARVAKDGESLATLAAAEDAEPLQIVPGSLLIVSDDQPVAVAGVVGGRPTSVRDSTTRVLLEAANFDFLSIRKAQAAMKVFTEASARFSRGVDPEIVPLAVQRICALWSAEMPDFKVTGGGLSSGTTAEPQTLELSLEEVNASLGTEFSMDDVLDALRRVGIEATVENGKTVACTVTSARQDISIPADIIEEVARLLGYDRLPETMTREPLPLTLPNDRYEFREQARDAAVRCGLQEIITYTLSDPAGQAALHAGHADIEQPPLLSVLNSTTPDRTALRRSLVPAMLSTMALNQRHADSIQLFEVGVVVRPEAEGLAAELPSEPLHLVIGLAGLRQGAWLRSEKPQPLDFHDAASTVSDLCQALTMQTPRFEEADLPPYQPGQCAQVMIGDSRVGTLGRAHPAVLEAFQWKAGKAFLAELDLDTLYSLHSDTFTVVDPPRHPSIEVDVTFDVPVSLGAGELASAARRGVEDERLRQVDVIDVYREDGSELKSVSLRFTLNAGNRSMQREEGLEMREAAVAALGAACEARVRE